MKKYSSSLHSFSLRSFPFISVALKCNELYIQIAKCFLLLNLGMSSALLNATVLPVFLLTISIPLWTVYPSPDGCFLQVNLPSQIISNWFPECDIEFTVQRQPPDFNPIGCGGKGDSEMDVQSIGKVVFFNCGSWVWEKLSNIHPIRDSSRLIFICVL